MYSTAQALPVRDDRVSSRPRHREFRSVGPPFVTWFGAMMPSVVACHLESYPEQKLDGKGSSQLLQLPSGCRHSRVVKFRRIT